MKLSMETIYLPEATFTQKKEMMADWVQTSNRAANLSYACAVTSIILMFFLLGFKDEYFYVYGGSAVLFLIGGILCKKWSFLGYVSVFLSLALCALRFNVDVLQGIHIISAVVAQAVFALVPSYFAFRCAYNYNYVFKELRKSKGFPNFIANTADLYGDKIYLKGEDETVYEGRVKASYNPFSTGEQIREEEVRREMDAEARGTSEPIRMDIGADGTPRPGRIEPERVKYEHGFSIFGKEIIFKHNDIARASVEEKRLLMGQWRDNIELTTGNVPTFILLMMVAIMASTFGNFSGIFAHALVLFFILGTNQMKMGKWYAPLPLLIGTISIASMAGSDIAVLCIIGAFVFNPGIVIGTIRYILNYRLYKELSTQPGFPSFIQNTADMYADKMYIVEPQAPVVKKDPSQRPVRVMDIGYDNKPKKDDGPWNAFDYMDKKDNEDDEND